MRDLQSDNSVNRAEFSRLNQQDKSNYCQRPDNVGWSGILFCRTLWISVSPTVRVLSPFGGSEVDPSAGGTTAPGSHTWSNSIPSTTLQPQPQPLLLEQMFHTLLVLCFSVKAFFVHNSTTRYSTNTRSLAIFQQRTGEQPPLPNGTKNLAPSKQESSGSSMNRGKTASKPIGIPKLPIVRSQVTENKSSYSF